MYTQVRHNGAHAQQILLWRGRGVGGHVLLETFAHHDTAGNRGYDWLTPLLYIAAVSSGALLG